MCVYAKCDKEMCNLGLRQNVEQRRDIFNLPNGLPITLRFINFTFTYTCKSRVVVDRNASVAWRLVRSFASLSSSSCKEWCECTYLLSISSHQSLHLLCVKEELIFLLAGYE